MGGAECSCPCPAGGGRRTADPQELHPADLAQVLRELYDDDGGRDELGAGARTAAELRATPEDSAGRLVTMLAALVEPL